MIPYKNISGNSSVESYSHTENSIVIKFKTQTYYEYSTSKNTYSDITKMISLAIAGAGLGAMLATKPYHPHDKTWR